MAARLDDARGAARRRGDAALRGLEQWLRIPSISGDPAHRRDVARAADWIAQRLAKMTHAVKVVPSAHNPVVLARVGSSRSMHRPLIVYGHLDVKAPGPGWTSMPFEPVRRGGLLFARGASDDKGQFMAHVAAVEAWASVGGPPIDVAFIVDGAEEVGSPGLKAVVDRHRDFLGADAAAIVVSDTKMAGPGRPTLTVSQRGMLGVKVVVSTGRGGVHAGRYGGAVIDPSQVLAAAILRGARAVGRLSCAGRPPGPSDADVRAGAAGRALHPDRLAERSTTCGALTVTSFESGSTAGAIPATAKATLDIRLPPAVDAAKTFSMIAGAMLGNRHPQVGIRLTCVATTPGVSMRQASEVRENIDRACRLAFGRPVVTVASGGSIPAVDLLFRTFGRPPILLGFGPADDGAHGPDERIHLGDWAKSVETAVLFMEFLSRTMGASPRQHRGSGFGATLISRGSWGAAAFT
jgi:succinyl-diaminopimelate desuccinylase